MSENANSICCEKSWHAMVRNDPFGSRWPVIVHVMLGRLVLLTLMLIGLTALAGNDAISFYVFIALAFVVTIPFALWLRGGGNVKTVAPQQFLVDIVVTTGLIHYTGGINSQLFLLYPLVILAAGTMVSGRLALKMALVCIFMYATLVVLEAQQLLAYRGAGAFPYENAAQVGQILMLRIVVFTFFAAASSYLADRCAYQNRQLERLRQEVEFIFDHASVALLAVHPTGKVVLANSAAVKLFGFHSSVPEKWNFADCFVQQPPRLRSGEKSGVGVTMQRGDGTTFQGAYEASDAVFPHGVGAEESGQAGEQRLFVVAIRDVSEQVQIQLKTNESTRLQTAVNMACEVGHWIRNPLTSIKVAGEFVSSVFKDPPLHGSDLSDKDRELVQSMCQVISDESRRLEEKIDELLRCADQDYGKLLDIMAEADTWTGRVKPLPEVEEA